MTLFHTVQFYKNPFKMKLSTLAVIFSMFWSVIYAGRRVHRARRNAKNLPAGSNIQGRKGLAEAFLRDVVQVTTLENIGKVPKPIAMIS